MKKTAMSEPPLTLRALNRATLGRQFLLERARIPVTTALERLVGLQAQAPLSPYVGLWTRLQDFQRDDLAQEIENRRVLKATMMRATLHLVTAADYLGLRGTLRPALLKSWDGILKGRKADFDVEHVLGLARAFLAEQPHDFAEISALLSEQMPDYDIGAMRYRVRTDLPLVQVPIKDKWSYPGNPQFTLAETWLGQVIPAEEDLPGLVRRYLAAFGPASITDMQTWSGLPKLKAVFETLRSELRTGRDEQRREWFDLPDAVLPDPETPVPVRFLPEFDNLLLSHDKRTRVIADQHRKAVYLPGLRVAATILLDGFVGGVWKLEKAKGAATLVIEPFAPLSKPDRMALSEEGERLVHFIEAQAKTIVIRFVE